MTGATVDLSTRTTADARKGAATLGRTISHAAPGRRWTVADGATTLGDEWVRLIVTDAYGTVLGELTDMVQGRVTLRTYRRTPHDVALDVWIDDMTRPDAWAAPWGGTK